MNSAYSVGEYPMASGVGMARCHTLLRRNTWEDISAGGSVNSAYSVGEYPIAGGVGMARCHTLLRRKSVGGKRFPQNARNSQNLLAEKGLPRMNTDVHRCRRVWHSCHTHAAKFCVFCEFCGRTAHPKYLCKSVKSVGEKIFPQNARNSQNLLQRRASHR